MKIEYFALAGKERPAVLIYGNEPENVAVLAKAVHALLQGGQKRFAVHGLPGFESVDGCQLFFSVGSADRGVRLVGSPRVFECSVRPLWWENIEGLLEPFCTPQPSGCFQYLDTGFYADIQLIISTGRDW